MAEIITPIGSEPPNTIIAPPVTSKEPLPVVIAPQPASLQEPTAQPAETELPADSATIAPQHESPLRATPTVSSEESEMANATVETTLASGEVDAKKGARIDPSSDIESKKSVAEIQKEIVDPAWDSAYHQVMTMDETALEKSGLPAEKVTAIKAAIAQLKQLDTAPDGTVSYNTITRAYVINVEGGEPIEIPSASLINSILDAEGIIAIDATNPDAAALASKNINVFETYRTADRAGLKAKTADEIAREKEAEKTKEVEREVNDLSYDLVDEGHFGLEDNTGKAYFTVTPGPDGKDIYVPNKEAIIENLKPNHPLARLTVLVSFHGRIPADTAQNIETRSFLTALMRQELLSLESSSISMSEDLTTRLGQVKNNENGKEYFKKKIDDLTRWIRTQVELPAEYKVDPNHLITDLFLAHACEHLNLEPKPGHTDPDLPEDVEGYIAANLRDFDENDKTIIKRLAQRKNAGSILKSIGIDIDELKAKDANTRIAKHTVNAVNQRREERKKEKLEGEVQQQFETVAAQNLHQTQVERVKQLKIPGWLGIVGLGVILLMPIGQGVADDDGAKGGGGGGGGGGG